MDEWLEEVVQIAVNEFGVPVHVEFNQTLSGGHDDMWFAAGFANGTFDIDFYADIVNGEYLSTASSGLLPMKDPQIVAAFLAGAWKAMSI